MFFANSNDTSIKVRLILWQELPQTLYITIPGQIMG
jgi:hypothetical protein